MRQIMQNEPYQLGQKIYCGYVHKNGFISKITPNHNWVDIDIVYEDGHIVRRITGNSIANSNHWKISDIVLTPEQLDYWIKYAERANQIKEIDKKNEASKFEADVLELKKKHPHLEQGHDCTIAAKNIKKELALLFPATKFSVKSDRYAGGNSINVTWIDGPTAKQVDEIIKKYESKSFDGMTDSSSYIKTPWNTTFGDSDYCNTYRELSMGFIFEHVPSEYWQYVQLHFDGLTAFINHRLPNFEDDYFLQKQLKECLEVAATKIYVEKPKAPKKEPKNLQEKAVNMLKEAHSLKELESFKDYRVFQVLDRKDHRPYFYLVGKKGGIEGLRKYRNTDNFFATNESSMRSKSAFGSRSFKFENNKIAF